MLTKRVVPRAPHQNHIPDVKKKGAGRIGEPQRTQIRTLTAGKQPHQKLSPNTCDKSNHESQWNTRHCGQKYSSEKAHFYFSKKKAKPIKIAAIKLKPIAQIIRTFRTSPPRLENGIGRGLVLMPSPFASNRSGPLAFYPRGI